MIVNETRHEMTVQNLNLRHLRAYREVGRSGSISAASERVFMSQPAITQALAKLEKHLQAPLFIRKSSGMFLTEPGTLFLNRTNRALAYLKMGAQKAGRVNTKTKRSGFTNFEMLLTTAQLRALLAISETGNFTWAARKLGISQPSVHRLARDLERLSGLSLFNATAYGIDLTPAARSLEQYASLSLSELNQGIAEVNAWLGHDTAHLRIGTLPLARSYILPVAINEFLKLRPDVRVSVVDGPYDDLLLGVRHGRIDLLVGALRNPAPVDDIIQDRLFDDELAIVARAGHPLSQKKQISVQDLASYPWATPGPGIPTRQHFDALFADAQVAPPSRIVESSSLILIREMLLRSDRLTIISAHQIQHEVDQGLLQYLNFNLSGSSRHIGVTIRKDWQPTETQSLLLAFLRRASDEKPDLKLRHYSKIE